MRSARKSSAVVADTTTAQDAAWIVTPLFFGVAADASTPGAALLGASTVGVGSCAAILLLRRRRAAASRTA